MPPSMTAASMPTKASAAKAARAKDAKYKPGASSSLDKTVSFAEAFLRGGVANYIGTYWSVGDASAKTFAGTLYSRLIAGDTVGDALLAARREVFDKLKNLDWADYIHYGNQSFALKDTGGGA